MNRAELRRRQREDAKANNKHTFTNDQIRRMQKEYLFEGMDKAFQWSLVVFVSILEDHFDFTIDDTAKLKEYFNLRVQCLHDKELTDLEYKDLEEQTREALTAKTRAEAIREMPAEEMAIFLKQMVPKFIRKDKRSNILEYLLEVPRD